MRRGRRTRARNGFGEGCGDDVVAKEKWTLGRERRVINSKQQ